MENRFIRGIKLDQEKLGPDSYVREIPALKNLRTLEFHSNLTFFAGENGAGKSTLLEAIALAYGFNPEGGSKNFNFTTMDTHSGLHEIITVVKGYKNPRDSYFLRAESFYNVASKLEEYDSELCESLRYQSYGGKSLHQQSHGESFLALMQNRFSAGSIYLLDEPEAALSPQKQLAVLARIKKLMDKGTQFIIASHSPILLGTPGAEILTFNDSGIQETAYEDTDSYRVTEMFIQNRDYFLGRLFRE